MARYAAGEGEAFGVVYEFLAPRLYAYLLRSTRAPARAEDLLQQTLLQIHRARGRFHPGAELTPWAFAIARRLLIDGQRRLRLEPPALESEQLPEVACETPGPAEQAELSEMAAHARVWLTQLPDSLREPLLLIKVEGLSNREAGAVLGITEMAARLRLHRALVALRARAKAQTSAVPEPPRCPTFGSLERLARD